MFLSAALNMVVSHLLFVVGRATDSVALEADAWHLRTDVYTSIGVLLGLFSIWLGRRLMPGVDLAWIDPVAAIVVALLIIRAAYGMVIRSARDILDHSLPDEEVSQLKKIIARRTPSVFGFHDLKTRKGGSTRFVEFHLLVDPKMSVDDSHRVTQILDEDIGRVFSEVEVTIHIEPCDRSCLPKCSENCLISDRSLRPKKT
jgi:cation diffusion facilitator family transporter